jgi:predicted membrane metal-binding protein
MWILQLLPDAVILWFCNILLLVGIVLTVLGFFVQRIPFLYQYQLPFRIAGVVLLAAGVYFRGGYAVEMTWRERVAALEKQLAVAEAKSAEVNTVVQNKIVYRDKVIQEQGKTLVEYVDREVVKTIPQQCDRLSPELIEVHNRAAAINKVVDEIKTKETR